MTSGILLVDKAPQGTSFQIVSLLRRRLGVETIGHAGTLDPFATGVMVMLIGREFTRKSDLFLHSDKQYRALLLLGASTDSHDIDGQVMDRSEQVPTGPEVERALCPFQGEILQTPPMFSAKKIRGQKLCDLARRGITVERQAVKVRLKIELVHYQYPHLELLVDCSKGTYIRVLAHDIGISLGSYAHLMALCRTKSGPFTLSDCIPQAKISDETFDLSSHLRRS